MDVGGSDGGGGATRKGGDAPHARQRTSDRESVVIPGPGSAIPILHELSVELGSRLSGGRECMIVSSENLAARSPFTQRSAWAIRVDSA